MSEGTSLPGDAPWRAVLDAQQALERAVSGGDARAIDEARLAYDVAHERWSQALAQATKAAAAPARAAAEAAAPQRLNAHLWRIRTDASIALFGAEDELAPGPLPRVGVCLSGGGSRSLSASMGALRGLRALGLLDQVSFLSSVSGGSWAATTFTYLPDAIDDDTFLGPVVADPGQLTWWGSGPASLESLSRHAMGYAATRISILGAVEVAWRRYWAGDPPQLLWQRAIGELILGNFGLGDVTTSGSPAQYYSYTESWLKRVILAENRGLEAGDFRLVRAGRPYLIVNSALFYPPPVGFTPKPNSPFTELYPFELTPLGSGLVPSIPGAGQDGSDLGGGYVDPFAFGSVAPSEPVGVSGQFSVPTPPYRFALSDMTGTSSAAFAQEAIQLAEKMGYKELTDLDPYYLYWPVKGAGEPNDREHPYYLGDGGILENIGITPLLRRRIPSIIAFANTSEPLVKDAATGTGFHQVRVSSDIPPLFGYEPWTPGHGYRPIPAGSSAAYAHNQVFPSASFPELVLALWDAYQGGGTALMRQTLTTVANPRFGVPAGDTPTVLWVHLNPVTRFNAALSSTVRDLMYVDPFFWSFPNYATVTQLQLGARQVTLLGHLACWNVLQNASVFRSMFPAS